MLLIAFKAASHAVVRFVSSPPARPCLVTADGDGDGDGDSNSDGTGPRAGSNTALVASRLGDICSGQRRVACHVSVVFVSSPSSALSRPSHDTLLNLHVCASDQLFPAFSCPSSPLSRSSAEASAFSHRTFVLLRAERDQLAGRSGAQSNWPPPTDRDLGQRDGRQRDIAVISSSPPYLLPC